MKILRSYKNMMKEFINEAEVDDDKIIKYKDKDGESAEMKASSAKTMEKDHPAKIVYDKMKGDGDSGEKEKGKDLGASDFERPGKEKPSGEEPSSDQEVPDNEEDWAKEMGYDGGPIEDEYSESKEDYEDSQNPKYADDFSDEEKAEIEKRWKGAQKKYNAYVKKGVEKGWLDKDGFRDGLKVAFAGIPDEEDEPSHAEIIQHIEDEGYGGDAIGPDGNPTPEAYEDAKEELIAQNKEKDESITINGQKYRPIKESKQHILKENYEKFFGSLK